MISFYEALKRVDAAAESRCLATVEKLLADTVGMVTAADITAPRDVQPFDNAAMDGFAVRMADVERARKENPVILKKASVIAAAKQSVIDLKAGTCAHVMTGAPVPTGSEAVVPIEMVQVDGESVTFTDAPKRGAHIRRRGEDFAAGDVVLRRGTLLTPAHILPLATLGIGAVPVFVQPKILFIATGAELVHDLTQPLHYGQIYNSNSYYARAFLAAHGVAADVVVMDTDDTARFDTLLQDIQNRPYDIILSSGAVSAGAFDYVRPALEAAGAKILYHKIALKPGKPNLLAQLPSGQIYFGLPGNPVATAVGLRFFVKRAIAHMRGEIAEAPMAAVLTHDFEKRASLHMVLKAVTHINAAGVQEVTILNGQESFMVNPFLTMNAWVFMPQEADRFAAGDIVEVYRI